MFVRMRTRTPIVPGHSKSVDRAAGGISEPVDNPQSCATVVRVMDSPDELDSGPDGMGPLPRGPSFLPWTPARRADVGPAVPPPAARPMTTAHPMHSKRATVVSLLAIVLVAVVVGAASLVARYADTHIASPVTSVAPAPAASRDDQIDFTSSTGSGTLIMLNRSWISGGTLSPTTGNYLRIQVELVCTSGTVDYDPYNFQAFDQGGRLFELSVEGAGDPLLEIGTLQAGERVSGTLAFDMPRGDATLLMSDESDQTVTALRVPD